jgi:beta-1,4-mannosyltransferase
MYYSFKKIKSQNVNLVFLGRFPPLKFLIVNLFTIKKIISFLNMFFVYAKIYMSNNIYVKIGYISNKELVKNIENADIIFIPRRDILNSGNIALGFTFGKVIVGPNVGNIGALLNINNNPIFEGGAGYEVISEKLLEGLILSEKKLGMKNLIYSETIMDWEKIALQHHSFYSKILKNGN